MFKNSKAIFIERSVLPAILSIFSPIEISAITLGPFVFSKKEISEVTRNHENIHWQQYLDLWIIGFLPVYFYYWVKNLFLLKDGRAAYYSIPFEREAYAKQNDFEYLKSRKRLSWLSYRSMKVK